MIQVTPGKLFKLKLTPNNTWVYNIDDFNFFCIHHMNNVFSCEKKLNQKDVILYLGEKKLPENYCLGQFLYQNIILRFKNQSYYKNFLLDWAEL